MAQAKKTYKQPGYKRIQSGTVVEQKLAVIGGGKDPKPGKVKKVTVVDNTTNTVTHDELVKRLREQEATIELSIKHSGENFFMIGQALLAVREDKLYQADGFRGFNAWLDSRKYTKTRQTAYNLIAVAENLSIEEAGKLAPTVAYVVARASDNDARSELLALAGRGASVRQLKQRSTEQKQTRGIEPRSPGRPKKEKEAVKRAVTRNSGHSEHAPNGGKTESKPKADLMSNGNKRGRENAGLESGTSCILRTKAAPKASQKQGYSRKAVGQLGEDGPKLAIWIGKDTIKIKVL